ncbi:MAG TPA: pirin family protein [Armatimonadota bacterium]|jgi:hypothetical protein
MITIRNARERGQTQRSWLDSRHSFSFGEYYDPQAMGFRSLRVLNDDVIGPGGGFPMHPHRDMEILTIVLAGALEHRDSLGNGSVIRPGEVQRMSAGTGIMHSEANPSSDEPVHLLQIWLLPDKGGYSPAYEQRPYGNAAGSFRLVASQTGRDGSETIHQDADVWLARLSAGESACHPGAAGRGVWLHVATGSVTLNGTALHAGDGAAIEDEPTLEVAATEDAQVLLFDMA